MGHLHAEAAALIEARPEAVYAVLSDYRRAHPRILPKEYFSNFEVEAGGTGAGTVFRVSIRVLGVERSYHMIVSKPEPDRVLAEMDIESGLVTKFTVTPVKDGQQAQVRISTDWQPGPGISEVMERIFTPGIMRRIYNRELRLLADYIAGLPTSANSILQE